MKLQGKSWEINNRIISTVRILSTLIKVQTIKVN